MAGGPGAAGGVSRCVNCIPDGSDYYVVYTVYNIPLKVHNNQAILLFNLPESSKVHMINS